MVYIETYTSLQIYHQFYIHFNLNSTNHNKFTLYLKSDCKYNGSNFIASGRINYPGELFWPQEALKLISIPLTMENIN